MAEERTEGRTAEKLEEQIKERTEEKSEVPHEKIQKNSLVSRLWQASLTCLVVVGILSYQYASFLATNNFLIVSYLDIGQGDSILIRAPNGHELLIDGGPNNSIMGQLGAVMPFFDRSIDYILLTSPDKDHLAGFLDVINRYHVGTLIEGGAKSDSVIYSTLEKRVEEKGIKKILALAPETTIVLDPVRNIRFTVLFPDQDVSTWPSNDGSIIGRLTYGTVSFIFTGDAPQMVEQYLIRQDALAVTDILKIGHHGSRTSTAPAFVAKLEPAYAIISCGQDNSYGHPHPETLATLKAFGVKVLRTDQSGRITIKSNGRQYAVQSERN